MADDELEAIRQQRMQELMAAQGGGGGGGAAGEREKAMKEQQAAKTAMIAQILDQQARARLGRIASVKADKAKAIEDLLVRMAQSGQISGRVNEQMLIGLLEQVEGRKPKTTIQRRRYELDVDDDLDDL